MILYDINGVSLHDAAGRWWVTAEGSSHSAAVTVRSVDLKTPWMPGLVHSPVAEVLEDATVNLRVMVASRVEAVREARWEAVKALVTAGPFTLGRTVNGVRRTTIAKLRSIGEPDLRGNAGTLAGVIGLTILDGVFHSAPVEVTVPLTTSGTTVTLPAVDGSVPTFDWWARVNGPCGQVTLETVNAAGTDATRAAGWVGTKTASQRLFLRRFSAWTASGDAWTEPATPNQLGAVTSGAYGSLVLIPRPTGSDPMARAAKVRVTGAAVDSTTTVTIRAGGSWV